MIGNDFIEQMNSLVPKSLDDIVRLNRELLSLKPATEQDMEDLELSFMITNLKGVFSSGFIYKWVIHQTRVELLFLIGHKDGVITHTSNVIGFDPDNKVALTCSGSHYIIKDMINPDSDPTLLMGICAWSHRSLAGSFFGMPDLFY